MRVRAARRALATLASVAAIAGCTKVGGGGTSAVPRGPASTIPHELRFADGEDIGALNPMFSQQVETGYLGEMVMAWLFRYDHENRPVPELATEVPTKANGDIDAAGTRIVVKLRHGVVWSDGAPFTADDVIFTTNEMNDPRNPVVDRDGFDDVVKMDEPDKYTVVFHLKRPFGAFVMTFFSTGSSQPAVLPKHLFPHPGDLSHAAYNALPVGIGPFEFETWNRGASVTLVPNPRYWRGLPKLHRVTFDIFNNANTLLTQVRTGNVDLYVGSPPNLTAQLQAIRGYSVHTRPSYWYLHYDLNVARPALADVAVRRALRLALDRDEIVRKIVRGVATRTDGFLPPTYPDVPPPPPDVRYDVARANAMLDAAGWKRGPGGIRARHGVRLALTLVTVTGSPLHDQIVELTRVWWQELGVSLNVREYLASQLIDPIDGVLRKGTFDVALFGWGTAATDDLMPVFGCASFPPNGQNFTRWCDPALTPLLRAFQHTYDSNVQGSILGEIDAILVSQAPSIVLYFDKDTYTWNDDLTGYHPNQVSPFDDMMNVDI